MKFEVGDKARVRKDKEIIRQKVKYRIIKSWDEILFKERQ